MVGAVFPAQYEAGQALNALSRILTPSLARDLLPDVCAALTSSRVAVRKRAVLVLHHFFLKDPDTAPHTAFKHLLDAVRVGRRTHRVPVAVKRVLCSSRLRPCRSSL
jgi:AP-3 complex subunit delta-1